MENDCDKYNKYNANKFIWFGVANTVYVQLQSTDWESQTIRMKSHFLDLFFFLWLVIFLGKLIYCSVLTANNKIYKLKLRLIR